MELTKHIILLTFVGFVCASHDIPADQDPSIDDILKRASNLSDAFNFFWDEKNHLALTEYDIVMPQEEWLMMHYPHRHKRTAGIVESHPKRKRWPNGVVKYELTPGVFSDNDIKEIKYGFSAWEDFTCVKFEESTTDPHRVIFVNSGNCWSAIGMTTGDEPQKLGLASGCRRRDIVAHEVGHALGLFHEHTRPDRDDYITILWDNIFPGFDPNFAKRTWDEVDNMSLPYDYSSLMHYSGHHFAKNKTVDTIETKDPQYQNIIGRRRVLSHGDIHTINVMYNCAAGCDRDDSFCPDGGFVGKDCKCWCTLENRTARDCCLDVFSDCAKYVERGYCKISDHMVDNCRTSCKRC